MVKVVYGGEELDKWILGYTKNMDLLVLRGSTVSMPNPKTESLKDLVRGLVNTVKPVMRKSTKVLMVRNSAIFWREGA